jgi:hypothetical protein
MKRTKLFSVLMLMSVLAFSVMSFIGPTPDYYCFRYTGNRPVTDATVASRSSYDFSNKTFNTLLSCTPPAEVWCGFCIEIGSPYFNSTTNEPNWTNAAFISLLADGSPTEVYNDISLNTLEIPQSGVTHTGVFAYFEEEPE